jgi:catechol 2,3-dioxygenase-like lactoylglutathione lyase family enzyme
VPAYRYLHCNLNCPDAEALAGFYVAALGLRVVMRSGGPDAPAQDGEALGLPGPVRTKTCFVYDDRGARSAPGVELQQWYDPPLVGRPYTGANRIGLQALGFSVADVDAATARALALGARRVDRAAGAVTTLVDPTGVAFDLVAGEAGEAGEGGEAGDAGATGGRLRHLRQTCRDLQRSRDWYRAVGFQPAAAGALRLPDQPHELLLEQSAGGGEPYPVAHHAGLFRSALAVDDVHEVAEQLRRRAIGPGAGGVREVSLPGTAVGALSILFLRDPDGVTVELVQRDRAIFR